MDSSDCICRKKSTAPAHGYSYPTIPPDGDPREPFSKHGYFVVRGLLSTEEVEEIKAEASAIIKAWLEKLQRTGAEENDWDEIANRLPSIKEGQSMPEDSELSIRRLFRMAVHNDLFARMAKHEKIVSIVTRLLGPDVKLVQSMALMKPPGSGEKKWHQDNAYFRLTPCKVLGMWIALDPADCANGCMHILPGSHSDGVYKHDAPLGHHIDYGMVELPNADDVVPIILDPGDALIFQGHTAHYTPPNVSNRRRRSLQYHYAASECKQTKCPKGAEADIGTKTDAQTGTKTDAQTRTKTDAQTGTQIGKDLQSGSKPGYFDCDPNCVEPQYFYFKKGELVVAGRDYGSEYI